MRRIWTLFATPRFLYSQDVSMKTKAPVFALLFLFVNLSLTCLEEAFAQAAQSSAVIKIGVIQSLTGIAAEDGKTVVQALGLAADDINSQGKQKVELLIEDDGSQSKNSVTALEGLARRGVDIVMGATWSFTTNPLLALAARKHLVVFNTSTLSECLSLPEAGGFGFSNTVAATQEALPFETFLASHHFSNGTIVFTNNSWGETQLAVYRSIMAKLGVTVLDELRSTTYDANEWDAFVVKIKQRKADLVVLLLNKNDLEVFLRKAGDLGLKTSFFASKNAYDALRNTPSKHLFNGVCFTYPLEQLGRESDFRARYKNKFGEDARIYADNTYDALFIAVKGVEEARKRNIGLRDALRDVEYSGIVGSYKYAEGKSFSAGTSSLVCVRDGEVRLQK